MTSGVILTAILGNLLEIVITIITLVVSYYIIPCIKDTLVPWLKEIRIFGIVQKLVEAAEKMAESGVIEKIDKKAKVVELLKSKGIEVTDEIEAFIESAVKELDLISKTVVDEITKEE